MRNQYPGNCMICRKHVEAGAGHFQRHHGHGKWLVRCRECVGLGNSVILRDQKYKEYKEQCIKEMTNEAGL